MAVQAELDLKPGARPRPSAAYMRNEQMPTMFRWQPSLREANDDVKQAWRLATARTIDTFQNQGWLASVAEKSAAGVVGLGLSLNAKPNALALGWTQDAANQWARAVETRFSMWADNPRSCDAGGRFTFGQIQAQAYRHWLATGEVLATLPFFKRTGSNFATKVKLFPAWRLSVKTELPDLVNGIRVDDTGAAKGYLFRSRNIVTGQEEDVELSAFDSVGRPLVIHIFDGEPDQVRGISPFTPILKVTRQYDQLADATLTAALVQAVFAAMFKSAAPGDDVLAAMQESGEATDAMSSLIGQKSEWYKRTDLNLGVSGKILHGFPGDELQFLRSEHPNSTYEAFAKFLLREICAVSALTYEEFTGDWAGATFSSSKMGVATNWPRILSRRKTIVAPLAQRAYEAWLEEDIEAGGTQFPGGVQGYLANKEAASQANWRGPTCPQADELKTANAAQAMQELGIPDSVIFEAYGGDVDDWYEMRKREMDRRKELGIEKAPPPSPFGDKPGAFGKPADGEEPGDDEAEDAEAPAEPADEEAE